MSTNTIFIFEFVSGGGFNQNRIPNSLICEGFAMLRSIIDDFKVINFKILTMLDNRVLFLSQFLKADYIEKVEKKDNVLNKFKNLIRRSKYVFIIAPETSNILYNLTKIAKRYNKLILSSNLKAIKLGTSKVKTYRFFNKNKVNTPATFRIPYKKKLLHRDFIINRFREFKKPIIIKPEDGVGAESIYYFEKELDLLNFLKTFNSKKMNYILQEYITGRDLSVSLIGGPNSCNYPLLLSLNSQNVVINKKESEYFGGYTPLENYIEKIEIISGILKRINLNKFEGYFGIDFIENPQYELFFIEINPRLTTSYIGIKNVINCNIAELILDSKFSTDKDHEINIPNHSLFTRVDFSYEKIEELEHCTKEIIPRLIKKIPEFITPPISLNEVGKFSCFIATKTKNVIISKKRVHEIFKMLREMNFNITKPVRIK
ncbi:MAG: ATP-grasp domain-containing protein [Candidatus Thorarchaeota archaeon]